MNRSSEADKARAEKENIEKELNKIDREVEIMDDIMKSYYGNPESYLESNRNIRPTHRREALVNKIRGYQIKIKDLGGSTATSLYSLLDRIQWKTHYYNRTWIQWEKIAQSKMDDEKRRNTYYYTPDKEVKNDKKGISLSIDMLYAIQKKKYKEMGVDTESESKIKFEKRIRENYNEVSKENPKGRRIVMIFDQEKKECRIKYGRRQYDKH